MEYMLCADGKRRKIRYKKCLHCGDDFAYTSNNSKKKYCSKECMRQHLGFLNVGVRCSNCNAKLIRTKSQIKKSRNGHFFCNRKCKEFAQSLDGDCADIRPPHFGTGNASYRDWFERLENPKCCDCGETRKYMLQVHHIDGDRENNKRSNLEVVCANHHKKRHLYFKQGKWIYWNKQLTPRKLLDRL